MTKLLSGKYPAVDYLAITIGSVFMALGIGVFLVDAQHRSFPAE